jgi:hypothetical protein
MKKHRREENPTCIACGSSDYAKLNFHNLCPKCAKKAKVYEERRGYPNIAFNSYFELKEEIRVAGIYRPVDFNWCNDRRFEEC